MLRCRVSAKKKTLTDFQAAVMLTPFGGSVVLASMGEGARLLHGEEARAVAAEMSRLRLGANEWRWVGYVEGGRDV